MNLESEQHFIEKKKILKRLKILSSPYAKTTWIKYQIPNEYILKAFRLIRNEILLMIKLKMKFLMN
jgi:hypothetical protein